MSAASRFRIIARHSLLCDHEEQAEPQRKKEALAMWPEDEGTETYGAEEKQLIESRGRMSQPVSWV